MPRGPLASGSPQPVDLNILPERYRPRVLPSSVRIMWIVGVGALLLAAALFVGGRLGQARVRELQAEAERIRQELETARTPLPELLELRDQVTQAEAAVSALQTVYPQFTERRRDWPTVLGAILEYDPQRIELKELFQTGAEITVVGLALTQEDVLNYAGSLDRAQIFERVLVQSMQNSEEALATPPPLALRTLAPARSPTAPRATELAPSPTVVVPGPSPSETPILSPLPEVTQTCLFYDVYEIDDFEHKPIAVGEVQRRNMNPMQDRDRATFLGLAGHRYCIRAVPEAAAVDPVLTVQVGETVLSNDNCQPASVSPECPCPGEAQAAAVELSIDTIFDQGVLIEVTNKGAFGPDSWYTLQVLDISAAPEAGAGADPYEPDDVTPALLSPGEPQQHTFAPQGDVDRAVFTVRAGRVYYIATYALAAEVDTVLSVRVGDVLYTNDDIAPGQMASAVTLAAMADGQGSVTISNKGRFGAGSVYWLVLQERVPSPTPAPSATAAVMPTATPEAACADAFEPDDIVGRPIAVGAAELHSFCPTGDVDRMVFTAKHGHRYRVETSALAPGVDTVLSVLLGGATYGNDDRAPQDSSSVIEVVNTTGADAPAFVTVTNKGLYGSAKTYKLQVLDLGVVDIFEPDDLNGVEILLSEPQGRVFDPPGDVDKVFFVAGAHRIYDIYTSDLAPGVDTVLVVDTPRHIVNDDVRPGVRASSIQFENVDDQPVRVVVTINNKGQYGSAQRYTITVAEITRGDPYEVDDQQGVPFSVGGTQARTFYPQGDVDKVFFTAKVAHRYAVFTEQLDAGVDTVLFATMGAVQTANDNRAPGDPSSYLELFNDTAQDLTAQIAITNQGQYGVDKRYVLVIRDLGVEGLDSYEPDLTVLRSIALNEVQRHNFYPPGDIDRVVLQVTAGQRYAVFTCGNDGSSPLPIHSTDPFFPYTLNCAPLAPGVDTFLVVSGPVRRCIPESCQSENVPQNEFPSYTNSRVEFDAIQNGQVSITLFNRGNFGPNQFYFLRAYAVDPLPTQTPSPTRTSTPSLTPTQALASPTATATATEVATPTPTFTATETATAMPTPIFTATETAVPTPTATSSTPYPPGPTPTSGWGYPSAQERLAMWGGRPLAAPWPQAMAPIGGGGTIRFTLLLRMREKGP